MNHRNTFVSLMHMSKKQLSADQVLDKEWLPLAAISILNFVRAIVLGNPYHINLKFITMDHMVAVINQFFTTINGSGVVKKINKSSKNKTT